jgi:hypothetical protein
MPVPELRAFRDICARLLIHEGIRRSQAKCSDTVSGDEPLSYDLRVQLRTSPNTFCLRKESCPRSSLMILAFSFSFVCAYSGAHTHTKMRDVVLSLMTLDLVLPLGIITIPK